MTRASVGRDGGDDGVGEPAAGPADRDDVSDDGVSEPAAGPGERTVEELIDDRRRRDALHYLYARDEPLFLPDLADRLVECERGLPGDALPRERLRVYMSLYHDHLPSLAAAGAVTYDQDADTLTPGPRAGPFRPAVERAVNRALARERWRRVTDRTGWPVRSE